ncbi:hypothetical protein Hanom_Chr01g00053181 [Helianthus anomalus]
MMYNLRWKDRGKSFLFKAVMQIDVSKYEGTRRYKYLFLVTVSLVCCLISSCFSFMCYVSFDFDVSLISEVFGIPSQNNLLTYISHK